MDGATGRRPHQNRRVILQGPCDLLRHQRNRAGLERRREVRPPRLALRDQWLGRGLRFWFDPTANRPVPHVAVTKLVSAPIKALVRGLRSRRTAGAIAHSLRVGRQSQDRKGTRTDDLGVFPAARRRGDRISCQIAAVHESFAGLFETGRALMQSYSPSRQHD